MKRNCLLTMIAAFCLAACTNTIKTEITVRGDLGDPKPAFLRVFYTGDFIQKAQSIEDSVITFIVETTEPVYVVLDRSSNQPGTTICSIIADGTPIEVTIGTEGAVITKGSEQNMKLAEGRKIMKAIDDRISLLQEEYGDLAEKYNDDIPEEMEADITQRITGLYAEKWAAEKQIIQGNADNLSAVFFICKYADDIGVEFIDSFLTNYKYKDCDALYPVNHIIAGEHNKMPGADVVDFVSKDLSGKECHLTDYVGKGKYVLVDFWASWCGPCREEIPNIKDCYDKYNEKGFEVVGISFDNNQEDWEKCVQELGITWPQMSDLEGWDCAASDIYHVKGIPTTILYGPDGKVIKSYLRGEELGKTLAEYLDK